jgi:pilus assembly protein FimV
VASKGANAKGATQVASNAGNQQAHLTVAGTKGSANIGASGKAEIAALSQKLTLTNESLTTKQKENEELKSRVTELESLLRKKNRLITLKSEQLAKLQATTGEASPETTNATPEVEVAPTPAPTPEVTTTPSVGTAEPVDGADLQAQIANDLARENGVIMRGEDPDAAVPSIENVAAVEADPVPAVQPASAFVDDVVEPETDILSMLQKPEVLGGGALLGLLGLGGMWYMRRRKENSFEDFDEIEIDNQMSDSEISFDESSEIDESEFVAHDEVHEESTESGEATEDNGEEDILQEADVYIVYGLHDQAESELKQAIEKNPDNMAYRAKLLENYKAAGDVESFEEEAKAFMSHESADKDKYVAEITEWGTTLNPETNLFSGAVAAAGVAMVAGTAVAEDASEAVEAFDIDIDGIDIDDGLEDFNLDELLSEDSDGEISEIESELADSLEDGIDAADDMTVDINMDDLDLGDDLSDDLGGQFEEIGGDDLDVTMDSVDDLLGSDGEIDLSEGLDIAGLGDDLGDDLDVTNLNLDIDSNDFEKIMPEDNAYKSASEDGENEIEALLGDDREEDNLLAEFDDNLSFLDIDDDAEAIEETQIDTKLDLAKAYIDMGDIEGARSTLEEVIQDGSDDQKREAEELLHSTG